MTPKRRLLPCLAVIFVWANLNSSNASPFTTSLPSPLNRETTSSLPTTSSFSTRTQAPSGVIIDEAGGRRYSSGQTVVREKTRPREPPGSPVNLFMPDEFQFYTLNANGQLVMKQMTKQEIQGMIAAGSGGGGAGLSVDLSNHHRPAQVPYSQPKVSDVVQNVQNVLKNELNKPIQVPVSESSIPGSVNSQWTNMLPYILSGGSVDQQDPGMMLPTLDTDIDVVPLHGDKPSETKTNYIPVQSALNEEQEIKLITPKPSVSFSNGKPISLLGNMALDSGILGGGEIYAHPTKGKPSRPAMTPSYHKYTTIKPSVPTNTKDAPANLKNSTSNKPTLYIPLSVSPSLLAETQSQNHDNYNQTGNQNFNITPDQVARPNQHDKNTTKLINSLLNNNPPKKSTTYVYSDEPGFTRLPMIQVPVIEADKISTSTQRTNQHQTPMFEILPTISPASITSSTAKVESHPTKVNVGLLNGFKKPESSSKPSTPYRPLYEPITKSTTEKISSSSSYQPIYETKPSTGHTVYSTYRPVYEPLTKPSTTKTSTYRPAYEPTTKLSTTHLEWSTIYRPLYESETKSSSVTFKPTSFQSTYELSTLPSEKFKVTQYPSSTYYTTGKASTGSDIETRISTLSEIKVTKRPDIVHLTKEEEPSTVIEVVTKPSVDSSVFEVTKLSDEVQNSTITNEQKTSVYSNQKEPNFEARPEISSSSSTEKIKTSSHGLLSDGVKESESSTVLSSTNNDNKIATSYLDSTSKLSEKIFDSTDKKIISLYDTTTPNKNDVESETPTLLYLNTEKTFTTNDDVSDQQLLLKTESYVLDEDSSSVHSTIVEQAQESKTENPEYNTLIQEVTTKDPEIILKQTDKDPVDSTETIILSYDVSSQKYPNVINKSEEIEDMKYTQIDQKNGTDGSLGVTTSQYILLDETTTEYYTSSYDSNNTKKIKKNSTMTTVRVPNFSTQETTIEPLTDSTTNKADNADSTKIYDIPIDSIVNYLSNQLSNKKPSILISDNNKIITNQLYDSNTNTENLSIQKLSEKENTSQKVTNTIDNQSTKLVTENLTESSKTQSSTTSIPEKDKEVTHVYEKMETITEGSSSIENKFAEFTLPVKENEKELLEEEISTVKVIPVYDDEPIMYTLPLDVSSKTTFSPIKTTEISDTPVSFLSESSNNNLANTKLPELQEALDNYIKEHYDPKSSTTDKYDELLYLTTIVNEDSTNYKKRLPYSPSTLSEYLTTNVPEDHKASQNLQLNIFSTTKLHGQSTEPSSVSYSAPLITENIKNSETQSTTLKDDLLNEKLEPKTTMNPSIINKNNIETPIIYLELTSSKPEEHSSSQANKEFMTNSSLTRIKTKNPVAEVDKIILEAPAITSTHATVPYTLSGNNKMPNNVASGLIAGYPTYTQSQPMVDYITTSKPFENINKTGTFNTTDESVQSKTEEYQYTVEYEIDKTTSPTFDVKGEEHTVKNDITETPIDQSRTEIPLEIIPMNDSKVSSQTEENFDLINSSFIPPLEKINDLINQLNDYSIATTIVSSENFETLFNESNPTTKDSLSTMKLENLSKTSIEIQNNTHLIQPTLSVNYTDKPFQSSTKPLSPKPSSTSTSISNKFETTTHHTSKFEPDSTTKLTTMKHVISERPQVTSTYKTTKGPIDKVQSTIDKSAGRINLEEEKIKLQQVKPTEPTKYPIKNKFHYSTRKPTNEGHFSYTRKTTKPIKITTTTTTTTTTSERTTVKSTENLKESTDKWTLIPQKEIPEQFEELQNKMTNNKEDDPLQDSPIVPLDYSSGAIGLDQSNKGLDKDIAEFLNLCNEMSLKFWSLANNGLSSSRSVTMSPFGMISTLAMIFLGARGTTSIQMNDILKLDDVVTFNPHLVFQNITDTVTLARGQGIENAAFVRALFTDRLKVRKIMPFYKDQAQQFYEGTVVDINFSTAGDILKRRTNYLIRRQTGGRIKDFVKSHTVPLRSPLTALSANVFQTSCDGPDASSEGRDGEMYFAVSQTVKQRKLVPIPAVVWKSGVSAGYDPSLDATAIALGDPKRPVSMIMIMPGQQGVTAPGDNLEKLEKRLFSTSRDALEKLLKVVIPRKIEVQMPKFSHRSIVNVTSALKKMGFEPLFTKTADLKGINGAGHDLYLADMIQMNLFCTCGDENKLGNRHLSETYPGTSTRHTRTWEILNNNTGLHDNLDNKETDNSETRECEDADSEDRADSENTSIDEMTQQSGKLDFDRVNNLRQKIDKKRIRWFMPSGRRRCRNRRQTEPEKSRMKIDKPFLYLIRDNPTGLILHIGRFNPKSQS